MRFRKACCLATRNYSFVYCTNACVFTESTSVTLQYAHVVDFLCERACSECLKNFVACCCDAIGCGHPYVIIPPNLDWRNS